MSRLLVWFRRLLGVFQAKKRDAEMSEEMRLHLEGLIERNIANGMSREEARFAALRLFGGVAQLEERCRDERRSLGLDALLRDVRFAIRQLHKNPAFTAVVVLTLALGIGANTAIFSFFSGIILRPLPFSEPDRLAIVQQSALKFGDISYSPAEATQLQAQTTTLEGVASYSAEVATLTGRGAPESLFCSVVSGNLFSVLGSKPRMGRTFLPEEARAGARRVAVVSNRFWRFTLGERNNALGETITLNGVPFTIIGVMGPEFEFPRWIDAWLNPAGSAPEFRVGQRVETTERDDNYLSLVGRVKRGTDFTQAETELTGLVRRTAAADDGSTFDRSVHLMPMRLEAIGTISTALGLLLGFVGLVLLIACLNVANLLLARATTRQREIALRVALGASRFQIARQLLTESLVLSVLGGAVGVVLGWWGSRFLLQLAPADLPRLTEVKLDSWVLIFSVALSIVTGIGFGMAPVLHSSSPDLTTAMKEGAQNLSGGSRRQRLRGMLVATEVALSVVLLLSAGLLLRSFWKMLQVPLGYQTTNIISGRIGFSDPQYQNRNKSIAAYRQVLERIAALPGAESVAASFDQMGVSWGHVVFIPEGQSYATPEEAPHAAIHAISPAFFKTLGIPLLQGRDFTMDDDENAPDVVIINSTLARRYFPDGQAIGRRLKFGFGPEQNNRPLPVIIGVVADVKHDGPEAESGNRAYTVLTQNSRMNFFVFIRTPLDIATMGAALKRVVQEIDPNVPVAGVSDLSQTVAFPATKRRFPLILMSLFAGLALVLASIGIYAMTAYAVAQRTREIGIRMALGARAGEVVRLVLSQGIRFVFVGTATGLIGGGVAALLLRSLLFGIPILDPVTFSIIPLFLLAVAVGACWIPARRAAKVDPMIALRSE